MSARKKRLLYLSDHALAKSGFGRATKSLLDYLYRTGKYEILHVCVNEIEGNPELLRTPWKSVGSTPIHIAQSQDEALKRHSSYGYFVLDDHVKEFKPDIVLLNQDIWGVFHWNKPWFEKTNSIIWTTLDSLPLHHLAKDAGKKVKNYWVWSSFAEKAGKELDFNQIKTVHGPIDGKNFSKLDNREDLRQKFGVDDKFVIGYVFRNQLRKLAPNILQGFKIFKESREKWDREPKLLFHTSWDEGWKLHELCDEIGVDKNDLLTTYICEQCRDYDIKPFKGPQICKNCGGNERTTHPRIGVSETQLCEVYNLMDVFAGIHTSGGCEIPLQAEAKFCELPTISTNYSSGEESCDLGSIPIESAEYWEIDSGFRKASGLPSSIAEKLELVYSMSSHELKQMGEVARQVALVEFDAESVCPKIEAELDKLPFIDWDFDFEVEKKDPKAEIPDIEDDEEWLRECYKRILKMPEPDQKGLSDWMRKLKS